MTRYADNSSNDIDLREVIQTLWSSKWLIIAVALIVTCLASVYAFLATPIYQTSVHTLPPTASGLASYNVASQLTGNAIRGTVSDATPGIEPLNPLDAYKVFLRYLNSSTVRQSFFERYYLAATKEDESEGEKQRAWKLLDKQLTINLPQNANEYEASIVLEGVNRQSIASWANAYVELAVSEATKDLLEKLAGEVKIRQQSLSEQIATLQRSAEHARIDQIIRLKDALAVAEEIGLDTPADGIPLIAINTGALNTESANGSSLLYLRGAKALRSELEQLERRDSNDAYIAELPDLLKKQALLNGINLNPDLLSVAIIDRAAIVPEESVRPQKRFIIVLGFVLGIVLGLLIALAASQLRRRK